MKFKSWVKLIDNRFFETWRRPINFTYKWCIKCIFLKRHWIEIFCSQISAHSLQYHFTSVLWGILPWALNKRPVSCRSCWHWINFFVPKNQILCIENDVEHVGNDLGIGDKSLSSKYSDEGSQDLTISKRSRSWQIFSARKGSSQESYLKSNHHAEFLCKKT